MSNLRIKVNYLRNVRTIMEARYNDMNKVILQRFDHQTLSARFALYLSTKLRSSLLLNAFLLFLQCGNTDISVRMAVVSTVVSDDAVSLTVPGALYCKSCKSMAFIAFKAYLVRIWLQCKLLLHDFARNTSCHGVRYIVYSDSVFRR